MSAPMKVCIVGVGAIGGMVAGWLGSRLAPGRIQLSAIARGATLAALQRDGLRIEQGGVTTTVPLHATDDAAAAVAQLGPQDLVVVAVKAPALAAVAPTVQALCGPHSHVLAAMNGVPWWFFHGLPGPCAGLSLQSVDAGGRIAALIPAQRTIGCVVHAAATTPAPGHVRHASGNGLIIGRPAGAATDGDAPLHAVHQLLQDAGFTATLSPRIQRDVWLKLWGNMTMNPVSALTGAPTDRMLDDPLVRNFCSAVMLEAQAIGTAIGVPIDQQPEQRHAMTRKLGSFKTSMLQDVLAGRPLELDALVGAVREIGQHLGLATPNIDALFGLARLMASERGLYLSAAAPLSALGSSSHNNSPTASNTA